LQKQNHAIAGWAADQSKINVVIINAPCFLLGFQLADHQNLLNLILLPLEELVGQLVLRKALQQ